jgi:hypothetical protein
LHSTSGKSPAYKDPADEVGDYAARADMMSTLKQVGFQSMHIYDEVRELLPCGYLIPVS